MAAAVEAFLPIAELSAYQRKWTIKARVTNKSLLRKFNKGTGQGQVFHVELLDAMGGEIRASFFNQAVDKFHDMLEKGKCYTFSKGSIKVANRQYNNCNHRYELTFDKEAIVEAAADDAAIEAVKFSLITLKALAARTLPTTVDLCGVIQSFKPIQTVNSKEGVELAKREVTIVDDSATSMVVTLWAERAKQEDRIFEGHPVVVFKSVLVKDFRESRSGSLLQSGEMITSSGSVEQVRSLANMPEAARVQQWWAQGGSTQELVQLSAPVGGAGGEGSSRNATQTTLSGLRQAAERLGHQPEIFNVVTRLALVQTQKQGEVQPLTYMACQEPREGSGYLCQKRVDERGFCNSCQRTGKVAPRLTIRCRFVDFEDQAWLTSFHEAAQKILGMTAEEVRAMESAATEKGDAAREQLDSAIRKRYFDKPMNVTVRAKMSAYNGEPRTDLGVIDARAVAHGAHGREMLKEIHTMLSQQALAGA